MNIRAIPNSVLMRIKFQIFQLEIKKKQRCLTEQEEEKLENLKKLKKIYDSPYIINAL